MQVSQDLTYAVRAMRRSPGATAIAVLALALGIGANTAIFSVVNAVLLSPIAMSRLRDPSRLVMVWEKNPAMMAFLAERMPVALANFRAWKAESRSFEDMTAFLTDTVNLNAVSGGRPERVNSIQVAPNFFSLLGVRAGFGSSAGDRAVLLSPGLYRRRFGNDRNLAGKTIRVDGVDRTIAGVLPDGFELPNMWEGFDRKDPEVWSLLDMSKVTSEDQLWARSYFVYARLRPGVGLDQARSEMNVIARRQLIAHKEQNTDFGINVFSLADEDVGREMRRAIFVLQVAVGFVLLIACANVANLLLARAVAREREIAVRLALGAPRGRIIRLTLTESLLIAVAGGAIGILLAFWSLSAISALAPKDARGFHELRLDPLVLAFSFLVSFATAFVFGLAPALHASRQNIQSSLGHGARLSSGPQWMRNAMVVGEVALALILLVGAGLMIRTLSYLMNTDMGFRSDHLLTMQTAFPEESRVRCDQLLERVEHLPGVRTASLSSGLPMESVSQASYNVEGAARVKEMRVATQTAVSETYFATLGIPIRRGRGFTLAEAEAGEPNFAIVSESLAEANWPKQDPLGKVLLLGWNKKQDVRLRIVGIVAGVHHMGPDGGLSQEIYIPSRSYKDINLAVRTAGDPMALKQGVERALWSIDPQLPVHEMRSMTRVLHDWPEARRFYMMVLAIFAGLAVVLASLGLYGVLAYVVNMRTRELGIRMALGAGTREVVKLVMGYGLRLTAIGVVLGLAGALAVARVMQTLLFGIGAYDPVTFVFVPLLLVAVGLAAACIPALRATAVDPVQALRAE
jgi:putative ABC transport system permease protein